MVVDPQAQMVGELKPAAVVDAILAKAQSGHHARHGSRRHRGRAGLYRAGRLRCRGRDHARAFLGRVITQGSPQPNTGVPGMIGGYGKERVIHSPAAGVFPVRPRNRRHRERRRRDRLRGAIRPCARRSMAACAGFWRTVCR